MLTCICGKSYWPNQAWLHKRCVVNAESVVNKPDGSVVNASRQVVWQKANRTRYNEKMREYMKRYRASQKSVLNES